METVYNNYLTNHLLQYKPNIIGHGRSESTKEECLDDGSSLVGLIDIALQPPDDSEAESGEDHSEREESRLIQAPPECDHITEEWDKPDHHECSECTQADREWFLVRHTQSEFFFHHDIDSSVFVFGDFCDDLFEEFSCESLRCVDITDLLDFTITKIVDLSIFESEIFRIVVMFGLTRHKGPDRHREAIGKEIGKSQDKDDAEIEIRSCRTSDYGECRDETIDPSIDEFRQIFGESDSFGVLTVDDRFVVHEKREDKYVTICVMLSVAKWSRNISLNVMRFFDFVPLHFTSLRMTL